MNKSHEHLLEWKGPQQIIQVGFEAVYQAEKKNNVLSHTARECACFALCIKTLFSVGLTHSPLKRSSRKCKLEAIVYSAFPLLSKGCSLTQILASKGHSAIPFLVPYQSLSEVIHALEPSAGTWAGITGLRGTAFSYPV